MSATVTPIADSASTSAADAGTELASLIAALPELYQPLYGHDDHPAPAKRACADRLQHIQAVHDSLANLLKRPLRVLDLGCAQGYFSLHLAARGASVHGIDADSASIALCQHLAAAQSSLDVHFRLATVEDSLHQLDPAEYDLILGLSVLHHLAYKHGADQVRTQLASATATQNDTGTGTVLLLELALRDEPLPWAAALPPDPLALLPELAFVHQLASHATHLSDIARPLIVASNHYWILPPDAGRIDRHRGDPHALAHGHYRGSRHYYDSGTRLIKLFRYDQDPALDNPGELRREASFLRSPPPGLRTPALHRFGEHAQAGWLVRERLPGTLLLERLADLSPGTRHRILGDILAQLVSLEDAGLYHSDLRLWNILLGPGDAAQLIDYGAIGPAAGDRAWPHNIFLAFLIFVHELTTATATRPEPLRPAVISPWRLLPPYRAWLAHHGHEAPANWSFRRLHDSYPPAPDLSVPSVTDLAQPDPAASAADLWAAAVESALDIHTQASDPALLQRLLHLTAQHTKLERWSQELSHTIDGHQHQLEQTQREHRTQLEHAHHERDQAQAELALLRASRAVRLAAILGRLLASLAQLTGSLRRLLRRLPATAARIILARPWLNTPVQRLLDALPPLRAALQRTLEHAPAELDQADPNSDALPPEVARARRALHRYRADQSSTQASAPHPQRPSLAYLSPLPPARSGIADYSAELLPELAHHYAITLVNAAPPLTDPPLTDPVLSADFPVIDLATFRASAHRFARILYHMGNAEYHAHMIPLLAEHPGVVVLHDFFLGDLHCWHQTLGGERAALVSALRDAHGWPALRTLAEQGVPAAIAAYPANRAQCDAAIGVIVHSEHSLDLARQWLDPATAASFVHIPHLRRLPPPPERAAARTALGLPADAFVVCSFGFLGPTKCNHLLLDAWEHSQLATQPNARLVFVGHNPDSDYGRAIAARLRTQTASAHTPDQIHITGYADHTQYRQWLAAADVAVQLRQHSRGETSGTALDSLAHGLALIVNAHGSMAQLPADSHIRLPDPPQAAALRAALERLYADPQHRAQLAARARSAIAADHAPERIAAAYRDAIEAFAHHSPIAGHQRQLRALAAGAYSAPVCDPASDPVLAQAEALARLAPRPGPEHWYLDITALRRAQRVTGIERVTQALLLNLLADPALAQRIVPVRAAAAGYRQAWGYLLDTLDLPTPAGAEPLILPRPGDLFLGLDWAPIDIVRHQPRLAAWHAQGLRCWFLVHDILPITNPEWFTPQMPPQFRAWLTAVTTLADGCVCVSGATADSLAGWWADQGVACPPQLCVSHHGADLPAVSTAPVPLPPPLAAPLAARPTLLMVGTIEPRKGYHHAIAALEQLWAAGTDLNLIIVGGEGWPHDSPADRAPVSAIAARIRRHPEFGKRLFWPSAVSDSTLTALYRHASALLAASENEGFGLPLIEAAHHRLPLILRDIPVFREIAADRAWYFPASAGPDGRALAASLTAWLRTRHAATAPRTIPISPPPPTRTWADSAAHLARLLRADLERQKILNFPVAHDSANN